MRSWVVRGLVVFWSAYVSGACSSVSIATSAGASIAITASEERGLDGAATDALIDATLRRTLSRLGYGLLSNVGVLVRERRVLLTGTVKDDADHQSVVTAAAETAWVAEVLDALSIGGKSDFGDQARDFLISQDISSALLFDSVVKSPNYAVTVTNRTVYILGVAQSSAELRRVIAYARNTAYVRRVVPLVLMASDPQRMSPQAIVETVRITPVPSPSSTFPLSFYLSSSRLCHPFPCKRYRRNALL